MRQTVTIPVANWAHWRTCVRSTYTGWYESRYHRRRANGWQKVAGDPARYAIGASRRPTEIPFWCPDTTAPAGGGRSSSTTRA